jgi:hypothetical protein
MRQILKNDMEMEKLSAYELWKKKNNMEITEDEYKLSLVQQGIIIKKRNVPDELNYPDSSGKVVKMVTMNYWFDLNINVWFFKLNPGFLVVRESDLKKYNEINW